MKLFSLTDSQTAEQLLQQPATWCGNRRAPFWM